MKFTALSKYETLTDPSEDDFRSAHKIGILYLGKEAFYIKKAFSNIFYISYHTMKACYRRVVLVKARICCGRGSLPVESIVVCDKTGELGQFQVPGERAGKAVLEEMKELAPHVTLTCPPPKGPSKIRQV